MGARAAYRLALRGELARLRTAELDLLVHRWWCGLAVCHLRLLIENAHQRPANRQVSLQCDPRVSPEAAPRATKVRALKGRGLVTLAFLRLAVVLSPALDRGTVPKTMKERTFVSGNTVRKASEDLRQTSRQAEVQQRSAKTGQFKTVAEARRVPAQTVREAARLPMPPSKKK